MAEADTGTENINIRITPELLEAIDDVWRERGYNSRSEFIRQAIRDSVHESELSKHTLEALLESTDQVRRGKIVSSDDVREEFLNGERE
jgi:metal-responsive CopG/Arc/MetJ family transcriptional regulator